MPKIGEVWQIKHPVDGYPAKYRIDNILRIPSRDLRSNRVTTIWQTTCLVDGTKHGVRSIRSFIKKVS
jgi:hypothetical protein